MALPDYYDSPLHLPFNRTCLDSQLELTSPDQDQGVPGCWVLLRESELIIDTTGVTPVLPATVTPPVPIVGEPVYLGLWRSLPCRLGVVDQGTELGAGLEASDLFAGNPDLPIDLLSLGGLSRQVLHWEGNSRFCSKCGTGMTRLAGEWGKQCPDCGAHHFPHIHPCVIVVVRRPGEVLLARKPEWPTGRYSLVAGFLDFAECLEEAVEREVMEETGIKIDNIRYIGSQGWPFPSQLMAGFVADYVSGEVKVEEKELEDAGWYSVDDLPLLPPKRSIARYLIDTYARMSKEDVND